MRINRANKSQRYWNGILRALRLSVRAGSRPPPGTTSLAARLAVYGRASELQVDLGVPRGVALSKAWSEYKQHLGHRRAPGRDQQRVVQVSG